MTDSHPITPPPELVKQWRNSWHHVRGEFGVYIATQAANWGADQELEACVEWMRGSLTPFMPDQAADQLRAARRLQPPMLADQALAEIQQMEGAMYSADLGCDFTATRAALERLKELEQSDD